MGLSVYLNRKRKISYDDSDSYTEDIECVYSANITHNLNKMAKESGMYKSLWRPEEINATHARDIINVLKLGLYELKLRPDYFNKFNSPNGWGVYKHFIPFVEKYLEACIEYPDAEIEISR